MRNFTPLVSLLGVALFSTPLSSQASSKFELPANCIVIPKLEKRVEGYDVGYETRLSFSNDEKKVMDGEEYHTDRWCAHTCPDVPEVYYVRPSCRPILEQAAKFTRSEYLLDVPKEKILPYLPSEKRVYCGVQPPASNQCTSSRIMEEDAVFPLEMNNNQFAPPQTLDLLSAFKTRNLTKFYYTARDTAIVYAVVGTPSKKSLGAYTIASTAGKKVFVMTGEVVFGQTVYRGNDNYWSYHRRPEKLTSDLSQTFYTFVSEWKKVVSGHWFWGNSDPEILMKAIKSRADRLKSYWSQSRSLFEFNPRKADELDNQKKQTMLQENRKILLANFANNEPIFEYSAKDMESRKIIRLVNELTTLIIQNTAYFLANSKNKDDLLDAASLWWAARSVQIEFGCDPKTDTPYPNGSELVQKQADHQNCRRSYSNRAYLALNQNILKEKSFALDSIEWILAVSLSSRVERTRLYSKWLETLPAKLAKSEFPSSQEVSALLHEILQTQDELRDGKVLTWNGLRPASQDDVLTLTHFLDNTRTSLIALKESASTQKWKNPEFFQAFRLLWAALKKPLALEDWVLTSDSSSLATETASFEKTLFSLDASKSKQRNEILTQFSLSLQTAETEPLLGRELCRTWLKWLSANRADLKRANFSLREPKMPFYYESCPGLVGFWSAQTNDSNDPAPDKLEAQCKAGHDLSCLVGFYLDDTLRSRLTLDEWTRVLTEQPSRVRLSEVLYKKFAEEFTSRVKGKSKSTKTKWKAAGLVIHQKLRQVFLEPITPLPPTFEVFAECISSKDFLSLLSFERPIEEELEKIALKSECAYPKPEEFKKIVAVIARLHTMALPNGLRQDPRHPDEVLEPMIRNEWVENPVSALSRYQRWIEQMRPYSYSWISTVKKSKKMKTDEIAEAFSPYISFLRQVKNQNSIYFDSTLDTWRITNHISYMFSVMLSHMHSCEESKDDFSCRRDSFMSNESDLF